MTIGNLDSRYIFRIVESNLVFSRIRSDICVQLPPSQTLPLPYHYRDWGKGRVRGCDWNHDGIYQSQPNLNFAQYHANFSKREKAKSLDWPSVLSGPALYARNPNHFPSLEFGKAFLLLERTTSQGLVLFKKNYVL